MTQEVSLYIVEDFESAHLFLSCLEGVVRLQNYPGSTGYYGVRVVYKMLKKLQENFPNKVLSIAIDLEDDYAGYCFLSRLDQKDIIITNN